MDTITTSEKEMIHLQECTDQPIEDSARPAEQILEEQKEQDTRSSPFVP